jgi:hypothetical protein
MRVVLVPWLILGLQLLGAPHGMRICVAGQAVAPTCMRSCWPILPQSKFGGVTDVMWIWYSVSTLEWGPSLLHQVPHTECVHFMQRQLAARI